MMGAASSGRRPSVRTKHVGIYSQFFPFGYRQIFHVRKGLVGDRCRNCDMRDGIMVVMVDRRKRYDDSDITLRDKAAAEGVSMSTVSRRDSIDRDAWLGDMAFVRERIRAMHDDRGFAWSDVAQAFGLSVSVVRQRAYRARRERAAGIPVPEPSPMSIAALLYDDPDTADLMDRVAIAHASRRRSGGRPGPDS